MDFTQFDFSRIFVGVPVLGYCIYALIRGEFRWRFTTARRSERPVLF